MSGVVLRRSARFIHTASTFAPASGPGATAAPTQVHDEDLSDQREIPLMDARPAKRARVERNTRAKLISNTQNHKAKYRAVPSKAPRKPAHHKTETVGPVPIDFSSRAKSQWKIGPHVSAAGGVENTIINAAKVGANAFALFVKSQRKWTSSAFTEHSVSSFKSRMKTFGYSPSHILPHGSYLVNLGNPDSDKREKSYQCFLDDLKRCEELGLRLYNFHPGSTVGQATMDESISLIAECINRAHKETQNAVIVLENMAGSGNIVGSRFSDLGKIIEQVDDKTRVGVCLDTCHMFAAGYEIRTKEGWNATMVEFEREVGIKYLRGMHLNDSKGALGSKKDRHENIGLGELGLAAFAHVLADPRTRDLPLILETPAFDTPGAGGGLGATGGMDVWRKEVEVLNRLATTPGNEKTHEAARQEIAAVVKVAAAARDAKGKKRAVGEKSRSKRKRRTNEDDEAGCGSCDDGGDVED